VFPAEFVADPADGVDQVLRGIRQLSEMVGQFVLGEGSDLALPARSLCNRFNPFSLRAVITVSYIVDASGS
jgi:hypothetical protein